MREPALLGVAALAALAGCSLIYDPGSFTATDAAQQPDGMPDARPVDAKINDADIENLDITGTLPVDLAEGSGCIWDDVGLACTEDARAIPIIVTGTNIDSSAVVTLDGAGYTAQVVPAFVHENHEQLAIAVRIPPDLGIDDTGTATLTITVTQGAAASDFTEVTVAGLDDFVASAAGATVDIDNTPLDIRYATITIDSNIRFTGSEPARLLATSALAIAATIDVGGFAGVNGAGGAAGPGGCRGGGPGAPGLCGDGGGRGGADNVGGGGGGHRTDGTEGTGPGGAAGEATGDVTLAPLSGGNGGGGGGDATLGAAGGGGGGGGGVLFVTSEGAMTVATSGLLTANGGGGAVGGGGCLLNQHGGGGGGGSGGSILIRARSTFVDEGNTSRASVAAGPGGDTPAGAGCNDGGAGAPGRVRIDLASDDADPALVGGTMAFRGVVIDPTLPPVVTTTPVSVGVFGSPSHSYKILVEGQATTDVMTLSNRTGSAMLDLTPGMNRICVLQNDIVNASSDEGAQCVSIAFMPQ
jgi:hypothetical protein